jgi:formylglycine-generating enzyme required for sulfatase activity
MKHLIATITAHLLLLSVYVQEKGFAKRIEQSFKPVMGDSLFVNACECSNTEYLIFVADIARTNPERVSSLRPDSTGWRMERFSKKGSYLEPIVKVYHNHPKYANHPIVNISQQAAANYCEWLTDTYNKSPGRKYRKVLFRLPTKAEWEFAAKGIFNGIGIHRMYPWDGWTLRDKKGKYLANFSSVPEDYIKRNDSGFYTLKRPDFMMGDMSEDGSMFTAKCKDLYPPNEYGLYHMAGNVAEFINETGKTKGGSFISPAYYLQYKIDEQEFPHMELGAPFVGFRVWMVVLEK